MHARTAALLGVAVLVGLAGCAGVLPGGSDDTDYPAGTGPDGVTNVSTLLSTHQDRLAADSYRIRYEGLYAQPGGLANNTAIVASNATQERQLETTYLPGWEGVSFRNASRAVSRISQGNQTTYDTATLGGSFDARHRSGASPAELLTTVVSAGDYAVNETESRDGRTHVTFKTTTPVANASGQLPDEVQRFNATLQVDEDGRIWRAELFATGRTNGTEEVFYQEYRTLDAGGVTVPRPGWVDQATDG